MRIGSALTIRGPGAVTGQPARSIGNAAVGASTDLAPTIAAGWAATWGTSSGASGNVKKAASQRASVAEAAYSDDQYSTDPHADDYDESIGTLPIVARSVDKPIIITTSQEPPTTFSPLGSPIGGGRMPGVGTDSAQLPVPLPYRHVNEAISGAEQFRDEMLGGDRPPERLFTVLRSGDNSRIREGLEAVVF